MAAEYGIAITPDRCRCRGAMADDARGTELFLPTRACCRHPTASAGVLIANLSGSCVTRSNRNPGVRIPRVDVAPAAASAGLFALRSGEAGPFSPGRAPGGSFYFARAALLQRSIRSPSSFAPPRGRCARPSEHVAFLSMWCSMPSVSTWNSRPTARRSHPFDAVLDQEIGNVMFLVALEDDVFGLRLLFQRG